MPDIKTIKMTETDKYTYKTSAGPLILLAIGTVWCFVCILPLTAILENITNEDYILFSFAIFLLVLPAGFLLFTTGWLWYAAKTRKWYASFGWWLFSIGVWFEFFFIRFFAPHNNRYSCYSSQSGEHWCEPNFYFLALYFIVPVIAMILGLILVYMGKKKKKNRIFL